MKVFINVTSSYNWNRPPVGVIRVEAEVVRYLLSIFSLDISLCCWNKDHHKFLALDTRSYLSHLSNIENNAIISKPALNNECYFRPFDILLTIGLDWDLCFTQELHRLKQKHSIAIIGCCYDIIPILFPQYCVGDVSKFFGEYFLDLASLSDHILCISKSSEKDLLNFLFDSGLSHPPSTSVFELGDSVLNKSSTALEAPRPDLASLGIKGDFILLVSTIERRKNHNVIYLAYRKIITEKLVPDQELPALVFVGMKGWGVEDLLKDIELDPIVRGKILILDHVSNQELNLLYDSCLFTVYPSFYEGWGLPVAESLCHGKAVICSNSSSIPEAGGDLAIYADPYSATDYANKISYLCNHRSELEGKSNEIRQFYKPRKWAKTGEQVAIEIDKLSAILGKVSFSRTIFCGYEMSSYVGVYQGSHLIVPAGGSGLAMFGPHISIPPGRLSVELKLTMNGADDVHGVCKLIADGHILKASKLGELLKMSTKHIGDAGSEAYHLNMPECDLNTACSAFELVIEIQTLAKDIRFDSIELSVCSHSGHQTADIHLDANCSPIRNINRCIRLSHFDKALIILAEAKSSIPDILYNVKLQEIQSRLGHQVSDSGQWREPSPFAEPQRSINIGAEAEFGNNPEV